MKARVKPGPVCDLLARLARRYNLGTVGLAGRHAAGVARTCDPLEVFVVVDLDRAELFGTQLADVLECGYVHVYDCRRLSWAHPLHLCVRWLNVDALPVLECPRGAVSRWRMETAQGLSEALVALEGLPHFRGVARPTSPPRGEFLRVFGPPPFGGFLV